MSKNSEDKLKIRMISMKLGIVDTGEEEGFFASAEDELKGVKTCVICSVCGSAARTFVQYRLTGQWCFRCEAILYITSEKRICEMPEIEALFNNDNEIEILFSEEDKVFFKEIGIRI